MKWLIIYDIKDAKRLYRVAKIIGNYCIRVQKSVFETEAKQSEIEKMRIDISKVIDQKDYVLYFNICEKDWQKREKYGAGSKIELDQEEFKIL